LFFNDIRIITTFYPGLKFVRTRCEPLKETDRDRVAGYVVLKLRLFSFCHVGEVSKPWILIKIAEREAVIDT